MTIPPEIRRQVLERDQHRCRWCGNQNVELHHIVYRSQGGKHEVFNLIALCHHHHRQVHSNKRLYMPILQAAMEFHEKGVPASIPQVQRWMEKEAE